jgi:lipopolysaccharide heptosyltransferase I
MTPISFPTPPRRILIIKPSAIGDVVHALPVLNLLRRRWPAAHLSWLVTPACAGLLERHPQLDEVVRFERREFGRGWRNPRVAWDLMRFMLGLARRRFDLVVDLQGLFRSGWLAAATRAPLRAGFAKAREGAWLFYTHRVPTGPPEQHAIERYLTLAQAVGCERAPVEFHFAVDDSDRSAVAALTPGRYAVLLPGANWVTKQWPVERFAALVGPLRRRMGLECVVAGGPETKALAARIPGAVDLAGRTNLRQLVALLERAALVVANDTGPMHIAAALGRPLVTPFGPTNPVRTGPYRRLDSVVRLDIPCSPCYSRRCSHVSCLEWIGIDPVVDLAGRQMDHRDG